MLTALRREVTPEELSEKTGIDPWFTRTFGRIAAMEQRLLAGTLTPELLWEAKRFGFSDDKIGILSDRSGEEVRKLRHRLDIRPVYKMVDTCAAEFEAQTPYFYSTYEQENEAEAVVDAKAVIVGSGPIRIGQGIEFDYCSVHAAWALQEQGIKSVMINSNPETVSTDFDTSDRLYFEPLDEESVRDILENEAFSDGSDENVPPLGCPVRGSDGDQPVPVPRPCRYAYPGIDGPVYRHRVRPSLVRGLPLQGGHTQPSGGRRSRPRAGHEGG